MQKKSTKKQRPEFDMQNLVYGKVPPQAPDIEEAILGAIMLVPGAIDEVLEYLQVEMFYMDQHKRIFKAMKDLHTKSKPIDILTVTERLQNSGEIDIVGGAYFITKLTNNVVSSANIEYHSRIVLQKYLQREMIRLGGEMIIGAFEPGGDVFDFIDEVETNLFNVTNRTQSKSYVSLDNHLVKAIQGIEHMRHNQVEISGVTSGFPSIDKLTFGWQKTDLIVLAARPGVGKTAFALNLARNAAKAGTPVAFFSLEMSAFQLTHRLISAASEIPLVKVQRGRLEDDEMKMIFSRAIQPLSQSGIFIDDTAALNIFELRAKARRLKTKENIGLIVIDYLQLMSGTKADGFRNREQEISEISRNLKKLAKELDVPIIALSQLSRETEKRSSKEPQLSDLRESGAIEQDADAVIFIFRPEYHGLHRDEAGQTTAGETVIKFAKYRNGSPGSVKLRAELHIQKFVEMDDTPFVKKEKVDKNGRNKAGVTTMWSPVNDQKEDSQVDQTDTTFK